MFIRLHPYYRYEFTVSAVTVRPGPSTEQRVVTTAEARELRILQRFRDTITLVQSPWFLLLEE